MRWSLRRCGACGEYTLRSETCPHCGGKTKIPHPAPFNLDDKYLMYRLRARRAEK
ncbi:MAG: RNA-protein complex protein Nop10 [Candidatus Bathyarchaeia archaeon]